MDREVADSTTAEKLRTESECVRSRCATVRVGQTSHSAKRATHQYYHHCKHEAAAPPTIAIITISLGGVVNRPMQSFCTTQIYVVSCFDACAWSLVMIQLVQPRPPLHCLAPQLHLAHAYFLMQSLVRLATWLFATIVELFGCFQLLFGVVFSPRSGKALGLLLCKRLDLCWPQWVHFGSQEHHRTSWNPTEPHGIPWNLMESYGTSWNSTEPYGIPWKILEHGRIFWLLTHDYK
jgi:hypothetical protein